jgi:hypothetical protein
MTPELEAMLKKMATARAAILAAAKDHGEIACPCCTTGKLTFMVMTARGRVHHRAACSTKGCVSWRE